MRRFTPPAASPAIANSQFGEAAVKTRKPRETRMLANVKLEGVGQLDPQRAVGDWRRNRGDRTGHLLPAGLVDQNDLRADHEVSICRRDYAVFEFNEVNDSVHISISTKLKMIGLHAKTVRCRPERVNHKL
jgi:hypothetical protein